MGGNKVADIERLSSRSWDTFLSSDDTSVGVVNGVRVIMKKPALGAGLLIRLKQKRPPGDLIRIDRAGFGGADPYVVTEKFG